MARRNDHVSGEDAPCQTPLLTSYHNGCPGCWLDRKKATSDGALIPFKDLSIIALLSLSNSLPIGSLFSYVYFMIQDFGIAKSTTDIGIYVGFLGSALLIGRFMTSTIWGIIADRYGHKPVIFIGTASTFIFMMVFGFSTNYWMALISRFLIGAGNGMAATIRAYAFEICSMEQQALSLAVVGTMWGVALIIGPAIGGYLAQETVHNHTKSERNPGDEIHTRVIDESIDARSRISEDAVEENDSVQPFKRKDNGVKKQLWRNQGLMAAVTLSALWILHTMAYIETFPLWAVSPEVYGGLGFTTTEVADVLALSGVALLILQLFLFPRLVKAFGTIQVLRLSMFLIAALTATYPLIARLQGITLWAVLLPVSVVRNILAGCNLTGGFILVNNAVVSAQRGVANGLSTSVVSAFQAVGPACAGAIFTWAEGRRNALFLPGMWMVFSILSALSFFPFLATFEPFLPASLNNPLPEGGK